MPEITFTYSWIYDKNLCDLAGEERLEEEEVEAKKEEIAEEWEKWEEEVFKKLTEVTGLEWTEEEIKCYLISDHKPFSDPLTLSLYDRNTEDLLITVIHELIHRLFVLQGSNRERCEKAWEWIDSEFEENRNVRIYIALYAILIETLEEVFDPEIIEKEKVVPPLEDYERAWEIVQERGQEKVLEEFRSRVQS